MRHTFNVALADSSRRKTRRLSLRNQQYQDASNNTDARTSRKLHQL